jgi:hypothetical protein
MRACTRQPRWPFTIASAWRTRIVGGVFPWAGISFNGEPLSYGTAGASRGATSDGLAVRGADNVFLNGRAYQGLRARADGGTDTTFAHSIVVIGHNIGSGFIYDDFSDGGDGSRYVRIVGGNFKIATSGAECFGAVSAAVPSSGRVGIVAYSGHQASLPDVWINGTVYTGSASVDSWRLARYKTWFGSSGYPTANDFVGDGLIALIVRGKLTTQECVEVVNNPWQLFAEPQWLYTDMGSGSWTPLEVTG